MCLHVLHPVQSDAHWLLLDLRFAAAWTHLSVCSRQKKSRNPQLLWLMFDLNSDRELFDIVKKIIPFHLTSVSSFCMAVCWNHHFSVWPVAAHSSLCAFSFIPLVASAQRPEEVIQRYMEVVAGVPDEVNVSWSGVSFPPPRHHRTKRFICGLFYSPKGSIVQHKI